MNKSADAQRRFFKGLKTELVQENSPILAHTSDSFQRFDNLEDFNSIMSSVARHSTATPTPAHQNQMPYAPKNVREDLTGRAHNRPLGLGDLPKTKSLTQAFRRIFTSSNSELAYTSVVDPVRVVNNTPKLTRARVITGSSGRHPRLSRQKSNSTPVLSELCQISDGEYEHEEHKLKSSTSPPRSPEGQVAPKLPEKQSSTPKGFKSVNLSRKSLTRQLSQSESSVFDSNLSHIDSFKMTQPLSVTGGLIFQSNQIDAEAEDKLKKTGLQSSRSLFCSGPMSLNPMVCAGAMSGPPNLVPKLRSNKIDRRHRTMSTASNLYENLGK